MYALLLCSIASPAEGAGICGGFTEVWDKHCKTYISTRDKWGVENDISKEVAKFYDADENVCKIMVYYAKEFPMPICVLFDNSQITYGETGNRDGRQTIARIKSWRNNRMEGATFSIKEDKVKKVEVIGVSFDEPVSDEPLNPRSIQTLLLSNDTDVEQTHSLNWVEEATKTVTVQHEWSLKMGVGHKVEVEAEVSLWTLTDVILPGLSRIYL